MSRFPLTSTPAQAALLARCMFGNGNAAEDSTRQDDTGLETLAPKTGGTGSIADMAVPAEGEVGNVSPHRPRDGATSG